MARAQRCTGRRRTTAITLPAERRRILLRRISRRRRNTRHRRATRIAMAAAARTAAAQAQLRGRTTRRLGHLRTIVITLRQRTPVLRHMLRDVQGSALTAETVATPPARIMAPVGTRIRAEELTRRAATDQLPRIRPAVMAQWGRTLRPTTRLRTPAEEVVASTEAAVAIPAVVVDTPAVADTGNFPAKPRS